MALIKPETRRLIRVIFKLLPIAWNYRQDRREIHRAEGKILYPEKYGKHAAKALNTFIDLGPAFIKLGQLLSVRPDVLPQPYIDEFSKLQDEVPPAPFEEVKSVIETDLGPIEKVFDSFDPKAVMGASLGQVYRACYHGKDVVVKVNRPNIKEKVALDTKVLKRLVPLVGRFIDPSLRFTAESVVDQFIETVQEELSYKEEASNLLTIKRNLKSEKDVLIPELFPEVSTDRVLVLEYIGGTKINDTKRLDEIGIDRKKLARRIARLYFKMLLSHSIFHADPHPGNISITNDSKIVLYDFGMVGQLDSKTRVKLVRFYTALVDGDSTRIVDIMVELGVLQPTANRYVIRKGVELAIADMQGRKVEETEVKALMEIANRTIYQFPFKLPKNLVLYMRMLSILEGICLGLDSKFRFIKILGRLLEEESLVEEAYREEFGEMIRKLGDALDATIQIPTMFKSFLENYQENANSRKVGESTQRGFAAGLAAGFGIFGAAVSILYMNTGNGKVGLIASVILLGVATLIARR